MKHPLQDKKRVPIALHFFWLAISLLVFQSNVEVSGIEWPQEIVKEDLRVVLYQPQVESLTANTLEARAAVSVTNEEYTSPLFGAMWFECNVMTDRDKRTVTMVDLKVVAARFPDVEQEKVEKLNAFLEKEIGSREIEMSLDALLADLDVSESALGSAPSFNNEAPEIIFTTTPSVLIVVDGDPVFKEIEGSNYEYVVNTPFFMVKDTKKDNYYINGGLHWYVSDNAADWEYTSKVPRKLKEIAEEALDTGEDGYASEEAMKDAEGEDVVPALILRTQPAELLQSDGKPEFSAIEGTSILFMDNTADDILMNIETQEYYILVSGRWYRSKSLEKGPWSFVDPEEVPEGFGAIPVDSDVASVRSSVAGTLEAKEAVLENQIPQTAEVDRKEAKLEVNYDGKPKFEAVGKTGMKYAINTDKSVLLIEGRYYCCEEAVWFESESATGPWTVSTVIPEQVQEIPPESPVYNVKYVYIYESTPDVVYVGYTPGYVHSYTYRGCVYYGTGWHYRPWYGAHYYPRPVTYGFNVHWNPWSGWGFSYSVSWGWMTVGWGSPYHGWWGPAGYRYGYHHGYHRGYHRGYRAGYYAGRHRPPSYRPPAGRPPRPTPYNRHQASNNIYRNRSQGVSRTGSTRIDPKTGNTRPPDRQARPSTQPSDRSNNMYTDRNGNVYRRDGEQWNRVDNSRPSTREAQPSTRETRPSTGQASTRETRPSTGDTRPSTGQPSTREARPSTGQPSTRETRPSTRESQPSTRQSTPSTRQSTPSTRQSTPSTRQSTPSTRQSSPSTQRNLEQDYQSRSRGTQRSQQYQQNRGQSQYSRPSGSGASRSSGSRSAPSRSSGRRR